jgi:hypothetical protein
LYKTPTTDFSRVTVLEIIVIFESAKKTQKQAPILKHDLRFFTAFSSSK